MLVLVLVLMLVVGSQGFGFRIEAFAFGGELVGGFQVAEFGFGAGEGFFGFFGQFDVPAPADPVQDLERFPRADPAFGDLLEVLDAVDDVPFGVFLGEIEQVDGAC